MLAHHDFDDDACCIHCGFDGAEWHHWRHNTWEGRAQPEARQPECTVYDVATRERNIADFRRGARSLTASSSARRAVAASPGVCGQQ